MHKEIWKDIKGYEGKCQISTIGRVRTCEDHILKICNPTSGYSFVVLYVNNNGSIKIIHQLVAEAFLGHKRCGFDAVVDHINNNPLDNRVENLRIITQRENTNKKHLKSSSKYTGVCLHKQSKKWSTAICINGKIKHLGYYKNEKIAAVRYDLEVAKINSI